MSYAYDCTLHEISNFNCSYIDDFYYFQMKPITKPSFVEKIEAELTKDEKHILNFFTPYLKLTIFGAFVFISLLLLIFCKNRSKSYSKIVYVV